jgi:sugar phosphate isomerase/epimerase
MNPQAMNRRAFGRTLAALGLAAAPLNLTRAADEPGRFDLGCFTRPWDQWDYRVALDGIAEAGFRHAGIMTSKGKSWVTINVASTPDEVREIARECAQRQLKIACIYGGDFPVAKSVADGIAGLKTLIDHAALCSCPHLMLGGTTDETLFAPYYRVVRECCDYAALQGVRLSIKPHGGQNATGPQCRAILEQVGHSSFGLWYDPGNIFYYSKGQLDPVNDSTTVDGLVVGVSVKDSLPPQEVLVNPGTGKVQFSSVFRHLVRGGFRRGPVLIECLAKGTTPAEVTANARQARAFLEALPELRA